MTVRPCRETGTLDDDFGRDAGDQQHLPAGLLDRLARGCVRERVRRRALILGLRAKVTAGMPQRLASFARAETQRSSRDTSIVLDNSRMPACRSSNRTTASAGSSGEYSIGLLLEPRERGRDLPRARADVALAWAPIALAVCDGAAI